MTLRISSLSQLFYLSTKWFSETWQNILLWSMSLWPTTWWEDKKWSREAVQRYASVVWRSSISQTTQHSWYMCNSALSTISEPSSYPHPFFWHSFDTVPLIFLPFTRWYVYPTHVNGLVPLILSMSAGQMRSVGRSVCLSVAPSFVITSSNSGIKMFKITALPPSSRDNDKDVEN